MKKTIVLLFILAVSRVCGMAQDFVAPESRNAEVQRFIDLYANRRKDLLNQMFLQSYVYFPLFEESLNRYQMPEELKYVPMVESTLNTSAVSRNKRMGLWQLTPFTATQYGLTFTDEVNDCFDPELATEVACQHLQKLYSHFDDWLLAFTAYNTSLATVERAIDQAGGKSDYWAIHDYLPYETRGYVPALLALKSIMERPEEYNLYPVCGVNLWTDLEKIIVTVNLSFNKICDVIGISMEELSLLNPRYVQRKISASKTTENTIRLPPQYATLFKQAKIN